MVAHKTNKNNALPAMVVGNFYCECCVLHNVIRDRPIETKKYSTKYSNIQIRIFV